MALLIVVLVTSVVVAVSWRFMLSMARNENRWHGSQARAYMEGGEQLARKVLREDLIETGNIDHLAEVWAQAGEALPTDEGWVRGTLEDAHSRFNLNLLLPPQQQNNPNGQRNPSSQNTDPWSSFSESQRRFVRLLQTFELEAGPLQPQEAMEIVYAIQDWLDPDDQPSGFGGAEADHYQSMDPPYPITNGPMTSVSELSLIKGVTPELYEKLVPLVIALPKDDVKMNINTLKPELLRALNNKAIQLPLDEEEAQVLVDERNAATEGFTDVGMFLDTPGVINVLGGKENFDSSDLVTASNYFIFSGETLVGEQVRRSKSLIFRNGNEVDVVRRTDSNF